MRGGSSNQTKKASLRRRQTRLSAKRRDGASLLGPSLDMWGCPKNVENATLHWGCYCRMDGSRCACRFRIRQAVVCVLSKYCTCLYTWVFLQKILSKSLAGTLHPLMICLQRLLIGRNRHSTPNIWVAMHSGSFHGVAGPNTNSARSCYSRRL